MCGYRLHLNLCQLKFFWKQEAKNLTQTELNNNGNLGFICPAIVWGWRWDSARYRLCGKWFLSLHSSVHQLCSQVGSAPWLPTSPGATRSLFTSKWEKRQASSNHLTRRISCANYFGWSHLIKVSRVQDYPDWLPYIMAKSWTWNEVKTTQTE